MIPRTVTLTSRNAYKYCNRAVLYGNSSASSSLHNKLFSHNNNNNNNDNINRNNINDNINRNNINNNNNKKNNNRDNMKLSGATEDNGILDLSSISAFSEPLSSPDNHHHHHHHHSFSGSNTASRRKKLTSFAVHVDDDDDDKYDEETKTSLKDIDDDSSPLLNHPNKTTCTNLNKPQSSPSSSSSHPYVPSTLLSLDLNAIDEVIYSLILSDKDNNRDDKRTHHHHHHQQQQHQDTSFNLTSPSINTQHLLCSLSVALASSSCNHDLGNKFIAPVQEIMNFTTDAKVCYV